MMNVHQGKSTHSLVYHGVFKVRVRVMGWQCQAYSASHFCGQVVDEQEENGPFPELLWVFCRCDRPVSLFFGDARQ